MKKGKTLSAEALAKHLNYTCISREAFVRDASKEFDIPEKRLHNAILESPGFLCQNISSRVFDLYMGRSNQKQTHSRGEN